MKNCLYITGKAKDTMIFKTKTSEDFTEWQKGMMEIKEFIRMINEMVHNDDKRHPLYLHWRMMVKQFGATWGPDGVPQDIKEALKSVEVGLGVDITVW